jgi:hypothetical protein
MHLQILVEFKIAQFGSWNATEAFSVSASFESDAPLFAGEAVEYETIGGTSMAVSIFPDTFKSATLPPFDRAPLTFAATQWSSALNAIVSSAPIVKEVHIGRLCIYGYAPTNHLRESILLCTVSQDDSSLTFEIMTSVGSIGRTFAFNFTATSGSVNIFHHSSFECQCPSFSIIVFVSHVVILAVFSRSTSQSVFLLVSENVIPDGTSTITCGTTGGFHYLANGRSVLCRIRSRRLGQSQKVQWTNFKPLAEAVLGSPNAHTLYMSHFPILFFNG